MSKKTKISFFSKASDTKPKTIFLEDWLRDTINPPKELKTLVNKYRNLRSKNLKASIPCVTISATFKKVRNLENIKQKNDFIVLDVDRYAKSKTAKSNICLDFDKLKTLLSSFKSCMYVGYSVSSDGENYKDGLYCVIKLEKNTSLKKAFNFFKNNLSRIGVNIDESCKDYTRLRFFSIDEKAYFNPKAVPFEIPKKRKIKSSKSTGTASRTDSDKVEAIISLIEQNNIDITSSYENWIKVAGALYNGFGERGRTYFHKISKFHPEYSEKKTDRKFDNCQNMKVDLSSFFYVATSNGIRY